jgi:sigma-B regulation protein RsbU (phosphoserine phosphatase)
MDILLADDDRDFRTTLEPILAAWGHQCTCVGDGHSAWEALQRDDAPRLALLDWRMPGLDGLEVCRRARQLSRQLPPYLILLTARSRREDVLAGLRGGADDYLTKPLDFDELEARLDVGLRFVRLEQTLADRVRELEEALGRLQRLQGLLPICSWCKKIRDDQNYWRQVEDYITRYAGVSFTHGICPDCLDRQLAEVVGGSAVGG